MTKRASRFILSAQYPVSKRQVPIPIPIPIPVPVAASAYIWYAHMHTRSTVAWEQLSPQASVELTPAPSYGAFVSGLRTDASWLRRKIVDAVWIDGSSRIAFPFGRGAPLKGECAYRLVSVDAPSPCARRALDQMETGRGVPGVSVILHIIFKKS